MNRSLLEFALMATIFGTATVARAQTAIASVDERKTVAASASGWVRGTVAAGGRGSFYVPVSASPLGLTVMVFATIIGVPLQWGSRSESSRGRATWS